MLLNYKKYLFVACVAALASCGKYLDRPAPDQAIGKDQLTDNDIALLLKGAYMSMSGSWPPQSYPMTDIYSDDIISLQGGNPAQFNPQAYEACNPSSADGFGIGRLYIAAYTAIGNANFVIGKIGAPATPAMRQLLGEALVIRAHSYNQLAEVFGGVVLIASVETDIDQIRKPKSTETEVLDQVEKDLEAAIPLLGDFKSPKAASKQAAQLLLARVSLQRGKHARAKELAEAVIGSGKRSLSAGTFSPIFRYNSPASEMVWQMSDGPMPSAYERYGLFSFYSPAPPFLGNGTGLTSMDDVLADSYEPGDTRREIIRKAKQNATGRDVNYMLKYSTDTLQSAAAVYVIYPLMRISEAYLISAEAGARQNVVDVTRYNQLRTARNASLKNAGDFANATAFLAELEKERRRELVGEGRRWMDMKRFGKAEAFLTSKGRNATRLWFPFTDAELLRNPKLKQNEGY
ncbi:RagB/SusD family nutrient uptake outer membrane protein [Chitinophaga caseinilytica]|uniref:RagB/SusD family nutrient uptake outer membrane protein n=1 Tax=Chitinophaga caseinilytica TaxID=2267521 RepID=UPI003C2FFCFB